MKEVRFGGGAAAQHLNSKSEQNSSRFAWDARETCHLECRWGNTQPTETADFDLPFFGKCVIHYKAEKLEARGIGWSEGYAGCPGSVSARGSPSRNPEVVIAQIPANTSIRICFTLCSVCLQKANTARRVFAFTLAWEARETCHLEWRWGNTQRTCFPFFPFSERRRGEVSWVWGGTFGMSEGGAPHRQSLLLARSVKPPTTIAASSTV